MRIVGGKYRGRKLVEFDADNIRPTSDMARESLFNVIGPKVYGCRFLDAFCGTGAVGLEAISRGADHVAFNDRAYSSRKILKENIELLNLPRCYEITDFDGVDCFRLVVNPFDIIYIDPPYKSDLGERAINQAYKALKDDGWVILEDEKPFDKQAEGLKVIKEKKYGRVYLTFFEKDKVKR